MERRLISNDVVIEGVPENKQENFVELIVKIGKGLKININNAMINECHKIGPIRNGERTKKDYGKFPESSR